jgi:hypothetical protein
MIEIIQYSLTVTKTLAYCQKCKLYQNNFLTLALDLDRSIQQVCLQLFFNSKHFCGKLVRLCDRNKKFCFQKKALANDEYRQSVNLVELWQVM